jgi:hypothetical protein
MANKLSPEPTSTPNAISIGGGFGKLHRLVSLPTLEIQLTRDPQPRFDNEKTSQAFNV